MRAHPRSVAPRAGVPGSWGGWARPMAGGLSMGFYPVKCALGLSFYEVSTGTVLLPLLLFLPCYLLELLRLWRQGVQFLPQDKVSIS